MVSPPDFVVVDDTSTAQPEQIKYTSGWTQTSFAKNVGNTGPPLYQSLHVATTQTSFTFTFNGAAGPLFVMGSILQGSSPSWTCTIDNKPMASISSGENASVQNANHVPLCSVSSQTMPIGDHTIKVSVAASEGNPAYFDYILYTPASKVRPGDLIFESSNQGITYGPNWQSDGSVGMVTSSPGDTFDFIFNGHTVSWIGFYDGNLGKGPSNAVYSIDGASPVEFTINNVANGNTVLTKQVFFQTASQGAGQHHIRVVYQGTTGSTPLTLDRLIIQNSTTDFQLPPFQAADGGSDSPISGSDGSNSTVAGGNGNGQQATMSLSTGTSLSTSASIFTTNVGASIGSFPSTTLELKPPFAPHSSTSATTSATASAIPSGREATHLRGGDIAGIFIAILGLLCIAIFFGCRILRRRAPASHNTSRLVRPFSLSDRPPPVPEKGHIQQPSATTTFNLDVERQSQSIFNLRPSKARRLAEAAASAIRGYRSRSARDLSYAAQTPLSERPSRIVTHQDSGVQLRQPEGEVGEVEVIEVPPSYASIQ